MLIDLWIIIITLTHLCISALFNSRFDWMIFDPRNIWNLLPHHNIDQGFLEVLETRTNLGFVGLDLSSLVYIHFQSKIYYNTFSIQIRIEVKTYPTRSIEELPKQIFVYSFSFSLLFFDSQIVNCFDHRINIVWIIILITFLILCLLDCSLTIWL